MKAKPRVNIPHQSPSPNWNTWAARIERLITQVVKPNGEPFVYLASAKEARIEGNYRDQFDQAKTGYLGALESLRKLLSEGDVFEELLEQHSSSAPRETTDAAARVRADADGKKVFVVHGKGN
jgi:hypothetical protein